jgi:amidase
LRIAFTVAPMLTETIHPDCVAGVQATAALLTELGREVIEATPPLDREPWLDAFVKIVAAETCVDIQRAARLVGRKLGVDGFEIATWVVGSLGRSFSAADYAGAARFAQSWSRQVGAFFTEYDVLLTPTLAQPPQHWNAAGLPIGMQFVARMGDEATLFRLAAQLEQARPWFDRAPPGY